MARLVITFRVPQEWTRWAAPCTISFMKRTHLGYLLTILSAAVFASTSLFVKLSLGMGMTPWTFTLASSLLAVLLLALMDPDARGAAGLGKLLVRPGISLFGIAGAISTIAFNVALAYITISLGTILLFTYPAFVALGAWLLLGQRPSAAHLSALALTLAGAIFTVNPAELADSDFSVIGVGLAVLTAVGHSLYLVLGERHAATLSASTATMITRFWIMAGVVLLRPATVPEMLSISWQAWLLSLLAAGLGGVAPFFLLNKGIQLIGANRAAIASVAELPVALGIGWLLLGDIISPLQWAGAVLIMIALFISQTSAKEGTPHGSGPGTA